MKTLMNFRRHSLLYGLIAFSPLWYTCTMHRSIVVKETEPLIESFMEVFLQENDLSAVKTSFPTMIKMAEAFHVYYPKSTYYLGKLCFLYATYAFGFLDETPYDELEEGSEAALQLLLSTYQKSYDYGEAYLNKRFPGFVQDLKHPATRSKQLRKIKKSHVDVLFWFNFSWAMLIFHDLANVKKMFELDIIKDIALTIKRVYPDYLYGVNESVFIAYYGGRAEILGGNAKLCDAHYQAAKSFAQNKSLIADYVYLRFAIPSRADSQAFEDLYKKIQDFDPDAEKSNRFLNILIQHKSEILYQKKHSLF